jgi:acetylornithine/N-succinyldiaminopimelate aminotransferase
MKTEELIQTEKEVILGTYTRPKFVLTHAKGLTVYDSDGNSYLDFVSGIAVNALGHCDELLLETLRDQANRLWHCSNLYYTEPQVRLAKFLVENTFADKVFFANSGAEAIEGSIKFARKWARNAKGEDCSELIAFNRSFHGRTMGALSVTGQAKFWQGFEPLVPGIRFAEFNNLDSVIEIVSERTCAVLVEPIQGEGGIYPAETDFLQGLRDLCDRHNILLILDEIQCGLGRTGSFCAYEQFDIEPDIMALAKPMAGGLPMGAVLMTDEVAGTIKPGDHASTFGGGPLIAAVAEQVVRRLSDSDFLGQVTEKGKYLVSRLEALKSERSDILSVRGMGLLIGVVFDRDVSRVIEACARNGLLVCKAGPNIVRFVPPLCVETEHIDNAIDIFEESL